MIGHKESISISKARIEMATQTEAEPGNDPLDTPLPPELAGDALFKSVYARLKAMAGNQLARNGGDSINTTGLVHELYLRMASGAAPSFTSPAQFFDYAAKAMRHIVIDRARARTRDKRGGIDLVMVELRTESPSLADLTAERALEIDDALRKLEIHAPRAARIVELHFFAGLSLEQVAEQLNVSTRTVNREWRFARAFLHGDPV
jgi:RNA polymerase sigma factor (TIGR02999 family)